MLYFSFVSNIILYFLFYRLPLARIYAQYFGGSLNLMSLYGHGCDLFLKLKDINESLDNLQI